MKIEQKSLVEYEDVDTGFRMKLPVLFQRLQRAALYHSESVGLHTEKMVAEGAVWILNRMLVSIERMPAYRETLTVKSWHKGSHGFRAGRDFILFCNGEPVAKATSQWLYYDLNKKRIAKIPKSVSSPYTDEMEEALDEGAIDFTVDKKLEPRETVTITTRDGDFDPNGHVNNAVYLEYLDTLLKRSALSEKAPQKVGIQYFKEIVREISEIKAGLDVQADTANFQLTSSSTVHAAGFVTFGTEESA